MYFPCLERSCCTDGICKEAANHTAHSRTAAGTQNLRLGKQLDPRQVSAKADGSRAALVLNADLQTPRLY